MPVLVETRHTIFESTSDTEVMAALLAEHPSHDIKDALRDIIPTLRGAFSAVLLTRDAVIGFRDPYGIRPLVLGELDDRYCLASETSALDIIGRGQGAARSSRGRSAGSTRTATTSSRWSTASARRSASSSSSTSPGPTR